MLKKGSYSVFLLMLFLCGCTAKAPFFSIQAYDQAVSLKVESLALLDLATNPYSENIEKINDLLLKTRKAYEYAKGRPNNEISVKMWDIILDTNGGSLYSVLSLWKEKRQLGETFITQKKEQIANHFDKIISFESDKPQN
jgi:hypothetical protein